MAGKRTPCVVGAPRISLLHKRRVNFVTHASHTSFPSHLLQPPPSSSRSRLLSLLLALHLYRLTRLYMYVPNITLSLPAYRMSVMMSTHSHRANYLAIHVLRLYCLVKAGLKFEILHGNTSTFFPSPKGQTGLFRRPCWVAR